MGGMPNFSRLLSYFQISFKSGIVIEGEASTGNYLSTPLHLVPNIAPDNNITGQMAGSRIILPRSGAVEDPAVQVSGFTFRKLLTTSPGAYMKPMDSDSSVMQKDADDEAGPFTLAMSAISQPDYDDPSKDIRIVAMNDIAAIVDSDYLNSTGNLEFTMNALNWLVARREEEIPAPRALASMALSIPNETAFWRIAVCIVILIPGLTLAAGLIVWLVRRRM